MNEQRLCQLCINDTSDLVRLFSRGGWRDQTTRGEGGWGGGPHFRFRWRLPLSLYGRGSPKAEKFCNFPTATKYVILNEQPREKSPMNETIVTISTVTARQMKIAFPIGCHFKSRPCNNMNGMIQTGTLETNLRDHRSGFRIRRIQQLFFFVNENRMRDYWIQWPNPAADGIDRAEAKQRIPVEIQTKWTGGWQQSGRKRLQSNGLNFDTRRSESNIGAQGQGVDTLTEWKATARGCLVCI